jgi:hypothetical protein
MSEVKNVSVNTDAIRLKIKERGLKIWFIAKKLGITYPTLASKINGKAPFNALEIRTLCEILGFTAEERDSIFFD